MGSEKVRTVFFIIRRKIVGEVMIQLQDVTMAYDGKIVIKSLDLAIAKGSKTVIIGPSGSGKSTLLRSMNLFERPLPDKCSSTVRIS